MLMELLQEILILEWMNLLEIDACRPQWLMKSFIHSCNDETTTYVIFP
jgi:hypothetical protein